MKHISKILAAALLASTAIVASPAPSAQAADKRCALGGKLAALHTPNEAPIAYARNWMANPNTQPKHNGVIPYFSSYLANGGSRNTDENGRPVRLPLARGQVSPGFHCSNPFQGYPSFVDVDGIWVPAGWTIRIETQQQYVFSNGVVIYEWRRWTDLPGTSTGRWYKLNGPTWAHLGQYRTSAAWRS